MVNLVEQRYCRELACESCEVFSRNEQKGIWPIWGVVDVAAHDPDSRKVSEREYWLRDKLGLFENGCPEATLVKPLMTVSAEPNLVDEREYQDRYLAIPEIIAQAKVWQIWHKFIAKGLGTQAHFDYLYGLLRNSRYAHHMTEYELTTRSVELMEKGVIVTSASDVMGYRPYEGDRGDAYVYLDSLGTDFGDRMWIPETKPDCDMTPSEILCMLHRSVGDQGGKRILRERVLSVGMSVIVMAYGTKPVGLGFSSRVNSYFIHKSLTDGQIEAYQGEVGNKVYDANGGLRFDELGEKITYIQHLDRADDTVEAIQKQFLRRLWGYPPELADLTSYGVSHALRNLGSKPRRNGNRTFDPWLQEFCGELDPEHQVVWWSAPSLKQVRTVKERHLDTGVNPWGALPLVLVDSVLQP